jgi:thioredoxin reductase
MSIYRNDSNTKGNGQADKRSAIVVGAGGAGLRAAVGLAESGLETVYISKLVYNKLMTKFSLFLSPTRLS